jgi:hypothetical protein
VTVGEDVAGPELAEKVLNVVWLLGGVRPVVTDPVAAGAELGRLVGGRRVLLVVDDVWSAAQVEPFLIGGPGAVRLFTTRIRGVLPGSARRAASGGGPDGQARKQHNSATPAPASRRLDLYRGVFDSIADKHAEC